MKLTSIIALVLMSVLAGCSTMRNTQTTSMPPTNRGNALSPFSDGAIADYNKTIERGNALKQKGDLDGAIADYTRPSS
jgi:outer membrane protein assembly factor BamE (lipoprotein component of BamABCDE complex)